MHINFNEIRFDSKKYQEEFRLNLDDNDLYEKIQQLFNYLFADDLDDRPLDDRRYIIITRKGFSLWVAGMLCGMIDQKFNHEHLISDRKWKLMTVEERNLFIEDKHVFVVDDSVITGAMSQSVYLDIEVGEGRALSRSVAFLVADENYNFESMFQYYYSCDEVNVERRREYNDKILFSMYRLAIPFTASSPAYHARIPKSEFYKLIEECKKNNENSWGYRDTDLDFGGDKLSKNTGIFLAPRSEDYGENVMLRGMRVCHSDFNADGMVDATFIPWIIFDAIDFSKAKMYLKECAAAYILGEKPASWLYNQLECGEPTRVQTVVHRIISYLYDCCILREFLAFFKTAELREYTLPNSIKLGQYHFPAELYEELEILEKKIREDGVHLATCLAMDQKSHNELYKAIFEMSYSRLELPNANEDIDDLEIKLFKQREVTKNKDGIPVFPSNTKKHPLICFKKERTQYKKDRSLKVLDLIRRAIGSLRSELISFKDKTYLINTLLPGEGSHLIAQKHYDFIYAYHYWIESGKYSVEKERDFVSAWDAIATQSAVPESQSQYHFIPLGAKMADALFGTEDEYPIYDWPSENAVLYALGINPHFITGKEKHFNFFKEIERIVDAM